MNPTNNVGDFTLAPLAQPPEPVPTERWAVLLLVVLMAMLGWMRLRQAPTL